MKKSKLAYSVLLAIFCLAFAACDRNSAEKVAKARKKNYRSVTVINSLSEKLVKNCKLMTASGIQIAEQTEETYENIVFLNFDGASVYKDESNFKIILTDRYGLKYEKLFTAAENGNTDVVIEEADYVKQSGDWKRKIEKKLNNSVFR